LAYKSQLEVKVAKLLGKKAKYETERIPFVQPAKRRHYTPDFKVGKNRFIEVKGRLDRETRQKHIWIKEQHPDIQILLLFGNAFNRLSKKSKTTYAEWAEANGLEWADIKVGIPKDWLPA